MKITKEFLVNLGLAAVAAGVGAAAAVFADASGPLFPVLVASGYAALRAAAAVVAAALGHPVPVDGQ